MLETLVSILIIAPLSITILIVFQTLFFPKLENEFFVKFFAQVTAFSTLSSLLGLIYLSNDLSDLKFFGLNFRIDLLSLVFLSLTQLVMGLINKFSIEYLHKDQYFKKFFFFLSIFHTGLNLTFLSNDLASFIVGWEFLGLSSIFLIAFYQNRSAPILNSLRVLKVYKISDGALVFALILLNLNKISTFSEISSMPLSLFILFLTAAMGKSALWPFSSWLPRSMEGPTPSSAVFYGALSVHVGIYLLWRLEPIWSPYLSYKLIIVSVGLITSLYSSFIGRVQTNAKTYLSYSTLTNLGIICIELALGFKGLALIHVCANALIKCLQFLRTPSLLHFNNHLEQQHGRVFDETGAHYENLISPKIRFKLYKMAYHEFGIEEFYSEWIKNPIEKLMYIISRPLKFKNLAFATTFFLMCWIFPAMAESKLMIYSTSLVPTLVLFMFTLHFTFKSLYPKTLTEFIISIAASSSLLVLSGFLLSESKDTNYIWIYIFGIIAFSGLLLIDHIIQSRLKVKDWSQLKGAGGKISSLDFFYFIFTFALIAFPLVGPYQFFEHMFFDAFEKHPIFFIFIIIYIMNSYIIIRQGFHLFYGNNSHYQLSNLLKNEKFFLLSFSIVLIIINLGFIVYSFKEVNHV